jgi:hypothetical protein
MSFYTMAKTLSGEVPGVDLSLAKNKVNEALGLIYDSYDWSFQLNEAGWLAPGQLANVGTFTTIPFQNTVIADATATAALLAIAGRPLLTELQYRDPARAIYNIIGYDNGQTVGQGKYPFATLTLDRVWMEPTKGPGQPYMIYQCYFPAPYQDFRKFVEIRDTTNARGLDYWSVSKADLARMDPQRTQFSSPMYVVTAGIDMRPLSATLGFPMFELWPHPLSYVPYPYSYRRRGPMLVNPTDTVPYPLTEELVTWRSKEVLYQFKESQKSEQIQRGSGANWILLSQMAQKEYAAVLETVQTIDVNLDNTHLTRIYDGGWGGEAFSNRLGQLNIGGWN